MFLLGKYHSRKEVIHRVIKNYDELNEELQDALDTLWSNEAGKLLLRSLCKEITRDEQRITILWDTHDEDDDTNFFDTTNFTIYLDTLRFGKYVGYCDGILTEELHTLDAVLFHELCHGLHKLNRKDQGASHDVLQTIYKFDKNESIRELAYKAWGDDEEIYTITGMYINSKGELDFDYLNTNTYMILQVLKDGTPPKLVKQRMFHCSFELLLEEYSPVLDLNLEHFPIDMKKYIDG